MPTLRYWLAALALVWALYVGPRTRPARYEPLRAW